MLMNEVRQKSPVKRHVSGLFALFGNGTESQSQCQVLSGCFTFKFDVDSLGSSEFGVAL